MINIDVLTKTLSEILSDKYSLDIRVTAIPKNADQEPQDIQEDRGDAA